MYNNKPPLTKKSVVILVVLIILAFGAVIFATSSSQDTATAPGNICLTKSDYTSLTGTTPEDDFNPENNFFTIVVNFKDGSSTYSNSSSSVSIEQLGAFYKNHPDKSILFAISSDSNLEGEKSLANARLERITSDLQHAGVHEDAIAASDPSVLEKSEGSSVSFATITISSSDIACQK